MDEQPLTRRERRELKRQEKMESQNKEKRQQTTKRYGLWMIGVIVIGLIAWGIISLSDGSENTNDTGTAVLGTDDWVEGSKSASVVLIEYSDFQCPACATFYPIIKQLHESYGDKVAIAYRHFPLVSIHPNAMAGARAAEAAGAQGKFFEFHDQLFERQIEWADLKENEAKEKFASYAQAIGLNVEQFKTDIESTQINERVKDDIQSGNALAINSTPTFFLQGKKLETPKSLDAFKKLIDDKLAKVSPTVNVSNAQ